VIEASLTDAVGTCAAAAGCVAVGARGSKTARSAAARAITRRYVGDIASPRVVSERIPG
jgi:hypothetical protein